MREDIQAQRTWRRAHVSAAKARSARLGAYRHDYHAQLARDMHLMVQVSAQGVCLLAAALGLRFAMRSPRRVSGLRCCCTQVPWCLPCRGGDWPSDRFDVLFPEAPADVGLDTPTAPHTAIARARVGSRCVPTTTKPQPLRGPSSPSSPHVRVRWPCLQLPGAL